MGRNRKDDARRNEVKVRLTDDELSALNYLSYELGLSKSEILRRGIDLQVQMASYSY